MSLQQREELAMVQTLTCWLERVLMRLGPPPRLMSMLSLTSRVSCYTASILSSNNWAWEEATAEKASVTFIFWFTAERGVWLEW